MARKFPIVVIWRSFSTHRATITTYFRLHRACLTLTSVRGTPLPNEGRFIWKGSIDGYFETGNAAG